MRKPDVTFQLMNGALDRSKSWHAGLEFGAHIVVAAVVFMLIAVVAVLMKGFVGWLAGLSSTPEWMLDTLTMLEYGLFVVDVGTFSVYVVVTTWKFLVTICKGA